MYTNSKEKDRFFSFLLAFVWIAFLFFPLELRFLNLLSMLSISLGHICVRWLDPDLFMY